MPEVNIVSKIVPKIGEVDTSDTERPLSCDEQLIVVSTIFGEGIGLPNSQGSLLVERGEPSRDYSSARGRIRVANDGIERPLVGEMGGGFLISATGAALGAGRLAFRASLGHQVVTKKHTRTDLKARQDTLATFLFDRVFSNATGQVSFAEQATNNWNFSEAVKAFLDDLYIRDEVIAGKPYQGSGYYAGPYKRFTAEILARLGTIRAKES